MVLDSDASVGGVGARSPRLQRVGVSPDLDVVDAPRVDRVGGYREVDAAVRSPGPLHEVAVGVDEAVPIGLRHREVSSDDDHTWPGPVENLAEMLAEVTYLRDRV